MQKRAIKIILRNHTVIARSPDQSNTIAIYDSSEKVLRYLGQIPKTTPLHIYVDTPDASISSIDLTGMNFIHRYQVKQRLLNSKSKHDLSQLIQLKSNLIHLQTKIPPNTQDLLKLLVSNNIIIQSIQSTIAPVFSNFFDIKEPCCVVKIPSIEKKFQSIFFESHSPKIIYCCQENEVERWISFISPKQQIPIFSHSDFTKEESWENHLLSIPQTAPRSISITHSIEVRKLYRTHKKLRMGSLLAASMACFFVTNTLSNQVFKIFLSPPLLTIQKKQLSSLQQINKLISVSQSQIDKMRIWKEFKNNRFPVTLFFRELASLLLRSGHVSSILIKASTTQPQHYSACICWIPKKNIARKSEFLLQKLRTSFNTKIEVETDTKAPHLQYKLHFNGSSHDFSQLTH